MEILRGWASDSDEQKRKRKCKRMHTRTTSTHTQHVHTHTMQHHTTQHNTHTHHNACYTKHTHTHTKQNTIHSKRKRGFFFLKGPFGCQFMLTVSPGNGLHDFPQQGLYSVAHTGGVFSPLICWCDHSPMMTRWSIGGLVVLLMGSFTHDTVKHWWTGCFLDDTVKHWWSGWFQGPGADKNIPIITPKRRGE